MSPNDTAKRKENASALIIKCMISPPSSQANNVAVDLGFLAETESSSAEISPPVRGRTSSARQRQYPATSAGKGKLLTTAHLAQSSSVCTENLVRIDCVTETPKRQRR